MPDQILTIIPNVESINTATNSKTEKATIKEIAPSPSAPTPQPQDTSNKGAVPTSKTNIKSTAPIVNKTKEPEILHPVDVNADTLTTIADKEEEEFIREVIKEHQDGSK